MAENAKTELQSWDYQTETISFTGLTREQARDRAGKLAVEAGKHMGEAPGGVDEQAWDSAAHGYFQNFTDDPEHFGSLSAEDLANAATDHANSYWSEYVY